MASQELRIDAMIALSFSFFLPSLCTSMCEGMLIIEIKEITFIFSLASAEICCFLQEQVLQLVISSLESSVFKMPS